LEPVLVSAVHEIGAELERFCASAAADGGGDSADGENDQEYNGDGDMRDCIGGSGCEHGFHVAHYTTLFHPQKIIKDNIFLLALVFYTCYN
jgi:hypothetical protein